jgi:hypothetical protein
MTEEAFNFDWIMPFEGKSSFSESISSRENLSKLFFCEIQRDSNKRKFFRQKWGSNRQQNNNVNYDLFY